MLRLSCLALLLWCACATPAPAEKIVAEAPPPLGDRYEIKFPKPPNYERGSSGGEPMHQFKLLEKKVEYQLGYLTLAGLQARADPKATQLAVEGQIKASLSANGIRILASEAVTLANTEFAKSFVGTREGQTVAGLGCASGDRLYVLMTQLDQSDPAQVSAGKAFTASFRP